MLLEYTVYRFFPKPAPQGDWQEEITKTRKITFADHYRWWYYGHIQKLAKQSKDLLLEIDFKERFREKQINLVVARNTWHNKPENERGEYPILEDMN